MSDVTLLTSIVEEEMYGTPGLRSFKLSGEPHAAAIVGAVTANYHRITGRERPNEETLTALIGEKVTLILGGENMLGSGMLVGREGRLFPGSRGGVAILPKGKRSKGYVVDPSRVVDVLPGWDIAQAQANVAEVRSRYPLLRNLTQERLNSLPRNSETCSLAVFGAHPFGGADCLWMIGEYWPEDDICDTSVLLIRPEFGTSEHGSVYGQELLRMRQVGEVIGFEPIPFADAIKLCSLDFDEAFETVMCTAGALAS